MSRRRFLVTAGNARERIDCVRDWGNIFTGNTGYSIARALAPLGQVDLLTSNRAHAAQAAGDGIQASTFSSHAELKGALAALLAREQYHAVFMTAAVADYRPAGVYQVIERTRTDDGAELWRVRDAQAPKVKSNHARIAVLGEQTEKLIDLFRTQWQYRGLLVKFKLEVGIGAEELIRIGQMSRAASDADYLVANTLEMVDGDRAGAYLISSTGHEFVPRAALAWRLAELVARTDR
ncbi:MAG TPA: phosphopantothenoylcysteine decarboxylase [Tepidisphaeraceae bacterium]|jgi:phosphopantothenate-cysteine ligase/phosphopantothenoylcysteine decarboxylase/phosphopantothenate--cysteine ligase